MKKYTKPELEITRFETEDIILASGNVPKTTIGDVEATGIGGINQKDYWQ